jgi:hypothetical protein
VALPIVALAAWAAVTPAGAHQFTRPAFYMTAVGVAVLLNAGGLKPPQPTLAPARPRGCYVIKTRESGPGVSSIPLLGRSFFAGDDYEIAAAGAHWGSATGKVAADGVVATSFPVNPSGIDGLAPTRVQLTMN